MTTEREITYAQALAEAQDICMARDPSVYIMGLGAPDAAAIFGSTKGLIEKFGPGRVVDMPVSEHAMTGVALGTAINGMRPVMTHIRLEFALLAIDQIVNQAAKWNYMFGGQQSAPMVIRLVVGRGWGQGPQHSQSLQSWFAHIPGLKVIMPATPYDAKGMMIAAIEDNNPVISIEHRWLYNIKGKVPEDHYTVPLGAPNIARRGADVTIAAASYMTIEALEAANDLAEEGIEAEVIDIRTLNPFDDLPLVESVKKTGRLIVADTGHRSVGFAAEVVARVSEQAFGDLVAPPVRIALPDVPTPTTRALANYYYPRKFEITAAARRLTGLPEQPMPEVRPDSLLDVPDRYFRGPF
ncbi:MAG: alpha-ketoacid dehydrogenase subunit beta [Hyphomicrobium sp.]|uniref:alpha-ketoacid dehydrogenase subunit beta n=1 Tax=Hyphomicrobium sp. TaxID=82 RepID=UPI001329E2D1|nr:pyruvate dehydrogenase complex E1 component subunit beta [Hyphomicrobium sp.]KAB2939018.1 MAG: alpha-ketoacid dehydrogenase subunit beta [Hyphomicrobium sp.]MBZ0211753.1 alpha-ketoacid dehydrogenase subunit beta [Hyphomicrobium sp.]